MNATGWRSRMFSGEIDRAAFGVYFLGAVVPLAALVWVLNRFALPAMEERSAEIGLLAAVSCIALLSFGAFLVLRQMMRATLLQMRRDNERLSGLLQWSKELGAAPHLGDVLDAATRRAGELQGAEAAWVFLKGAKDRQPSLSGSAGERAEPLYARHIREIHDLVGTTLMTGRSATSALTGGGGLAVLPLTAEAEVNGALAVLQTRDAGFDPRDLDALETLAGISAVALRNADLRDAQRNFFSHVTDMLVTALDSHLGFHHGHGQRVAQLANRVARAAGLGEAALQRIHFAALLHDIGMLKLDRNQQMTRATCDKHCLLGSRMLSRIRLWADLAPIVYHHHEAFDGSGYPDGLSGEEIPIESRVIALCDAVDSMTSECSYRAPLDPAQTLREVERCAGTQFDPQLVQILARLVGEGVIELGAPAGS